ncbi:hypothetical protein [Halospeciosus flavus]|uniref:Transposase n=1 Tax=Halospeciosus flavus TaxID=3032283 RepID=A0ABD5Z696_9EURY|nr:hypothetical protein [Halospeciosus flavus]
MLWYFAVDEVAAKHRQISDSQLTRRLTSKSKREPPANVSHDRDGS